MRTFYQYLILTLTVIPQTGNCEIIWSRTFGDDNLYEEARSIRHTSEGGYILAGWGYNYQRDEDVYVVKTDRNGVLRWDGRFGGNNKDRGYCVQEMYNGNFVVVGRTKSSGAGNCDLLVLMLNPDGDSIAAYTYGGENEDGARFILQDSDSNLVIVGHTKSYGAGDADCYIYKINSYGDSIWAVHYGGLHRDHLQSITELENGNYIVSGYTMSPELGDDSCCISRPDGLMMALAKDTGDTLWTNHVGGTLWYELFHTNILQSGDLISVGGGLPMPELSPNCFAKPHFQALMTHYNPYNGQINVYNQYGVEQVSEYLFCGKELPNGDICCVGSIDILNFHKRNKGNGYILLTDCRGDPKDGMPIRIGTETGGEQLFDFVVLDDMEIAISGVYNKTQAGWTYGNGDFWLVKYAIPTFHTSSD